METDMKTPASPRAASRSGMSLIELLVVMAIILVLIGIVIAIVGAAQRGAAEAKARSEIAQIVLELEKYRGDKGSYPPQRQLPAPHNRPSLGTEFFDWYQTRYPNTVFDMTDSTFDNLNNRILLDPWGRAYVYFLDSPFIYRLGSQGPDGRWGSVGVGIPNNPSSFGRGDDITNRNLH